MAHFKRNFYVFLCSFIALERFKRACPTWVKAHSHQVKAEAKAKKERQTLSVCETFRKSDSSIQIESNILSVTQCIKMCKY